jgi:hypothetical protein
MGMGQYGGGSEGKYAGDGPTRRLASLATVVVGRGVAVVGGAVGGLVRRGVVDVVGAGHECAELAVAARRGAVVVTATDVVGSGFAVVVVAGLIVVAGFDEPEVDTASRVER